jgi:hypothetical protein
MLDVSNVTPQNFMLWPNLAQIPTINATYEKMIAEEAGNSNGIQQNFQTGHKNFLKDAVYMLYESGQESKAQYWFNYLKKTYTNAFVGKEANISLEDFAIKQVVDDNNGMDRDKVEASIMALIRRAFVCFVRGNEDYGINYENLARAVWVHYDRKTTGADQRRTELKSFQELHRLVLKQALGPNTGLPPEARAILIQRYGPLPAEAPTPVVQPEKTSPAAP